MINPKLPFALFLHGASPNSQNTKFWTPIIDKIIPYCNPIFHDRFGHGMTELNLGQKIGIKLQISSIIQVMDHILETYNLVDIILIGRSQGGGYATRVAKTIPEKISKLGLIAPGSMKTNYKNLENWDKPISLLWDVDDPIVKFENYQYVKQVVGTPKLFVIGESDENSVRSISRNEASKSHAPELMAPNLFEAFMKSLVMQKQ
ncbi:MAG: alpha/beta fold hydrolase [Candidatus Kariarchaeaceae archaeon]